MMSTRTIAVSDDVYRRLARLKRKGESFTDVLERLTGRTDLTRFVGAISPALADELSNTVRASRAAIDRDFDERARRRTSPRTS